MNYPHWNWWDDWNWIEEEKLPVIDTCRWMKQAARKINLVLVLTSRFLWLMVRRRTT